ncbi:hypothetical protein T4B_5325 [Trichinella pseudospiralis]|uniref:Uncharacterized protein n=1 Tax=Trichinella pseudospiralis TaxID=6337 RepID=A0A0V1I837_TRIPS|nr:hypothetical protein T4B_5325 [Trichinella pseudospiralis]KRZ38871.1 hypothetical protein T4C_10646 [Trichinella pseudospiralis]
MHFSEKRRITTDPLKTTQCNDKANNYHFDPDGLFEPCGCDKQCRLSLIGRSQVRSRPLKEKALTIIFTADLRHTGMLTCEKSKLLTSLSKHLLFTVQISFFTYAGNSFQLHYDE